MAKILSLDIQKHLSPEIDISGSFPISEIHAIYNGTMKPVLDQILPNLPAISLYKKTDLEAESLHSFDFLDLIHPDVFLVKSAKYSFSQFASRKQKIIVASPLKIPFLSLDIRSLNPIASSQKYADIFTRNLSSRLWARRFSRSSMFFWRRNKMRIIWAFATLFLLLFPTIFFVKFSVENGYNKLLSLGKAKNISEWKQITHSAKTDFERAEFLFLPFSWIPWETVDTVSRAVSGGKKVATATHQILDVIAENSNDFSVKIQENQESSAYRKASKDIFPLENMGVPLPTNRLVEKKKEIFSAIENFEEASELYKNARWEGKYAKKMQKVWNILQKFSKILALYRDSSDDILTMLGHHSPERYIIFNQNRDEIRANGGFPGSIISFTLYKGNILDFRTDDVYYYDWNLYPHVETPPPWIALLTDNYWLRDVNYYPDFRETLEKANRFVERSGESTLTTAIAIHQGLVEEILATIGEVSVEGVDEPFTDKNFSLLMSILVENKFAKEKTPKDILFRFMNAFVKKMVESKKIEEIAHIIEDNWNRWEILMASRNEKVQNFLEWLQKKLPWKTEEKNWIYPIFTSVSGNKSDRYISRAIEAKTKPLQNCQYETTVSLMQEHNYDKQDAEQVEHFMQKFGLTNEEEQHKMRFIQGAGNNKNFVRLFVPKGAVLSGSGAEVMEEENATVFSFMIDTPLSGKAQKTLSYTQEIPHCSDYNGEIQVYRQPGLRDFLVP